MSMYVKVIPNTTNGHHLTRRERTMSDYYLIFDCGGTNYIAGVVPGDETRILGKVKRGLNCSSKETLMAGIISGVKQALNRSGVRKSEIKAIGAASAGVWHYHQGKVVSPNVDLVNKELALGKALKKEFGLPTYVENDVNAAVQAEAAYGYQQNREEEVSILAYLTISTGIGLGLWDCQQNRLISGEESNAPEVGHNTIVPHGLQCGCGGHGHWEAYGSGEGIVNLAQDLNLNDGFKLTTKGVMEAAQAGNEQALKLMDKVAYYNAIGFGHIINQHQPGAIVVGGTPVLKHPSLMLDPVISLLHNPPADNEFVYLPQHELPDICKTELGEDVVAYGAAAVAKNAKKSNKVL